MFPWRDGQVLLCEITGRGWCIPSGRVEPAESSRDAAIREAREEAGAILRHLQYLGAYRISEHNQVRWADVYAAEVERLTDISAVEESSGRRFVSPEELPTVYHAWNPLIEALFEHSRACVERRKQIQADDGDSGL